MKKKNRNCGVITILVSLMLVSVLSLGTLVIEAGRYQAAKNQLADATISACTSMVAAYDPELYDRYGLLAIDTERFTEARAADYLEYNADLSPSFLGNKVTRMYSVNSVEMQGMYNLTDPAILKRQILSRAKYHVIPQDYALNLYTADAFLADLQSQCDYVAGILSAVADGNIADGIEEDVDPDMMTALSELYETFKSVKKYDEKCKVLLSASTMALLPSSTGTVASEAPAEDTQAIIDAHAHAASVLGGSAAMLLSSGNAFSQTDVSFNHTPVSDMVKDIRDVASVGDPASIASLYGAFIKYTAQAINASVNMLSSEKDGNLLLNSYISDFFSDRNNLADGYSGPGKGASFAGENGNFASACTEYIFGGNPSEQVNQSIAYDYIFATRLIGNIFSVFTNSSSLRSDSSYSVLAHIAWACYETCCDMELLTIHNASVPLNKYSMILDVNSCGSVAKAFETHDFVGAMRLLGIYNESREDEQFYVSGAISETYRDALALALWLVPNSVKMMRTADLIQLEMRYREQYVESKGAIFLMSDQNTYCRLKCTAALNSLLPVVSFGENSGFNRILFTSIKYVGY